MKKTNNDPQYLLLLFLGIVGIINNYLYINSPNYRPTILISYPFLYFGSEVAGTITTFLDLVFSLSLIWFIGAYLRYKQLNKNSKEEPKT